MHRYLRAAGFPQLDEARTLRLIREEVVVPENLFLTVDLSDEALISEYRLPVNEHIGVAAAVLTVGEYSELKYCFPYFDTYENTNLDACEIERHTDTAAFSGVLDDFESGISLIFFVSNPLPVAKDFEQNRFVNYHGTALAAFANEGTVILPVLKDAGRAEASGVPGESLLRAALGGGDSEMDIETLTVEDISRYRALADRMETEDLYSVVEQTLMPCGVECDLYSIIGEILDVEENVNLLTGEKLYLLKLTCNDIVFWLSIRQVDLTGEPCVGRRIKCKLWMQGNIDTETGEMETEMEP